jgi:ProP effector
MTETTTPSPRAKRPRTPQRPRPANPQQQQRTREVHPVLEKLFELYPKMFGAQFLPLKLGAFQDLLAENPEAFKRDELKVALGLHARSTRYLECVAAGHPRHNLQGEPVEPVAPEHVHHAIMEVFRRRQARSREDLRPQVRARLIAAIEASGLSREDYAERTRTQDEAANALLDEAFADMAVQTAKREALMRAFEASGKTVEQFAEMYGMAPADVANAVERTRRAGPAQPQ